MHLWVSSGQRDPGNNILNLILSCIMAASEHGEKSSSCAATRITDLSIGVILSDSFNVQYRIEVLNKLNIVYEFADTSVKERFLQTGFLKTNISKLCKLVHDAGDYEIQVGLMEFLFRLMPQKIRPKYSPGLIEHPKIQEAFAAVRDSYFEVDCRKFLNQLNIDQGIRRKVFSYPCLSVTLGNVQLQKPCDMGYDEFWLDVNMESKRILIFCENIQSSSQIMSIDDEFWDTVSIWEEKIVTCVCQEKEDELHVKIFFKGMAASFPYGHDDQPLSVLRIAVSQAHLHLKSILSRLLGKKLCHPVNKPDLQIEEKQHKASEPSEPMSTPAASVVSLGSFFSQSAGEASGTYSLPGGQTKEKSKKSDGSQLPPRKSKRLQSKSAGSLSSLGVSRRKMGSLPDPAGLKEEQDHQKDHCSSVALVKLDPLSKEGGMANGKAENIGDKAESFHITEDGNKLLSTFTESSKVHEFMELSERPIRTQEVLVEESCRTTRSGSLGHIQTMESEKTEKQSSPTRRGRSRMKKSIMNSTVSASQPIGKSQMNNCTDDEKLKQLHMDQTASRCARYILRDCRDNRERAQVMYEITNKTLTVSTCRIDSQGLQDEMNMSKVNTSEQNAKSKKYTKNKICEQKNEPRKDMENSQVSHCGNAVRKMITKESQEIDFAKESEIMSNQPSRKQAATVELAESATPPPRPEQKSPKKQIAHETSSSHLLVDNDDLNVGFMIEIDLEPECILQGNCQEALNQSANVSDVSEGKGDKIRGFENLKLCGVKGRQKNKTHATSMATEINLVDGSASSPRKYAYVERPVSVSSDCENEDNEESNDEHHSQDNTAEHPRCRALEEWQSKMNATLPYDRNISDSRNKSVRIPEYSYAVDSKTEKKSKQKHATNGSVSKLISSDVREKFAEGVPDKNGASPVRRLRKRRPVSYKEDDPEQDTGSDSSVGEDESSQSPKNKGRSKLRSSKTGNTPASKQAKSKDEEPFHAEIHCADTDDSKKPVGGNESHCESPTSWASYISPVKFRTLDPRTQETGNELYQVTSYERFNSQNKRRRRKKTVQKKAGLSVSSTRECAVTDSHKRKRTHPAPDNRKKQNSSKRGKTSADSSHQGSDAGTTVEKMSEISWINAYKSEQQKLHDGAVKMISERNPKSPVNPSNDPYSLEVDLEESIEMMRGEQFVANTPRNCSQKSCSSLVLGGESTPDADRRASQKRKMTEADAGRQFMQVEESSPSPRHNMTGDVHRKAAPIKHSSEAKRKRKSLQDGGATELKRAGLVSGPSSVIRPSKSMLRRMFEDSFSSNSDDEDIANFKSSCLQPRRLFPDDQLDISDSKVETLVERRKPCALKKTTPDKICTSSKAHTKHWASENSEREATPLDDLVSQQETGVDAKESGTSVMTVMKGFGMDLKKQIKEREYHVQQLADGALKLANKRVNQLWTEDKKQWDQVVSDFKQQINTELSALEQEVADLNKVEKKTEAIYLEQMKMLHDKRESLLKGVKTSRRCLKNFREKSHRTQCQTREVQRGMETQMKHDMDRLKNKLLLDMQQQQLRRVKDSIQKHFF
ncbi:uncharacterized protein LOC143279948 isoform X2 [Babylonia areolata]|uniref:uncharacterized protein LOC143279948 isoform X2 n=1 Tax=Babylonia areolata TaxID=304850 RepID=UPI003FD01989